MKKAVLLLSAFVLTLSLFAQQKPAEDVVKFKETVYDFGKIKKDVPVNHDFTFINQSNGPIVIESAVASCGCTTPVKPEGAVPKGQESKIPAFSSCCPDCYSMYGVRPLAGCTPGADRSHDTRRPHSIFILSRKIF